MGAQVGGSRADPSSSVHSRSLTWLLLTWLVSPECCLMAMQEAGQEGWQCCVPSHRQQMDWSHSALPSCAGVGWAVCVCVCVCPSDLLFL